MKTLFSTVWIGLITHKLRSFLTILGVVIGVAAVIALMSVGRGAQASILSNIESMGADMISISGGASMFGGVRIVPGDPEASVLFTKVEGGDLPPGLGRPMPLHYDRLTSQEIQILRNWIAEGAKNN